MKEKEKFPTRKDMTYWIIILILFMVGSFTVYYGSDKNMVSHIGFGGTIVSILLAVIAIIYSFYQSSTYESTTYKLDTSAKQIEEATQQLSNVSEIKAVLENFKGEVKEINDSITDLKEISNNIGNGINSMRKSFEDTKKNLLLNLDSSFESMNVDDSDFSEGFMDKVLDNGGKYPLFTLILFNELNEKEISHLSLKKWNDYFVTNELSYSDESERIGLVQRFSNIQIGLITAFKQIGLVEVIFVNEDIIQIKDVNEALANSVERKVETLKTAERKDDYEFIMEMYKRLEEGNLS